MFEINVTVSCPDVVEAAKILASALGSKLPETVAPVSAAANPIPAGMSLNSMNPSSQFNTANPAPVGTPLTGMAPSTPAGVAAPAPAQIPMPPVGQAGPAGYTVAPAPLAQAPTYTLEQVSKAGADLITAQPAKMPELMALLGQYGVQTVNALRPEHLGPFATALRGMGAKI